MEGSGDGLGANGGRGDARPRPQLGQESQRPVAAPDPRAALALVVEALRGSGFLRRAASLVGRAAAGDEDARLAVEVYCCRAKKYVGAYLAVLGRVDAIVFTAGVGEHSPEIRGRICAGLEPLGVVLDERRNAAEGPPEREIQADGAPTKVLVVATDEEREIARATLAVVRGLEEVP